MLARNSKLRPNNPSVVPLTEVSITLINAFRSIWRTLSNRRGALRAKYDPLPLWHPHCRCLLRCDRRMARHPRLPALLRPLLEYYRLTT